MRWGQEGTPKPLPIDIEDALFATITVARYYDGPICGRPNSYLDLTAKITALLSGYIEDAMKWRSSEIANPEDEAKL